MHSVTINGKKRQVEHGAPLKEVLKEAGFLFPCGGTGRCGKCRIECRDLEIGELDRRFLTENSLADGVRLSCDKIVEGDLEITCEISESTPEITLRECSVAVSISDCEIDVCIIGEEPVETVTKRNPFVDMTTEELASGYTENPIKYTNALRAVIGKESVELFEKYGAAKAAVTGIAAKGLYLKILAGLPLDAELSDVEEKSETDMFGLPSESLYILPAADDFIGGEILAETVLLKERSILIDCEKTAVLFAIGEEDDIATALWDWEASPLGLKCITAATKLFAKEISAPSIYLYGKYSDVVEDALNEAGFTTIQRARRTENVANATMYVRTRSKLLKEKNRTTSVKIYDNEEFQAYLSEQ